MELAPPVFDLVIRGGTIVTATARFQGDIGVQGAHIAAITDSSSSSPPLHGLREIDAHERVITPGGVDPHVHLTCSDASEEDPGWVDDFESGSAAALAGGVTTFGNMSFVLPWEAVEQRLRLETEMAERQSIADVFLHPAVLSPNPAVIAELGPLAERGITSLKFFMSLPSFDTWHEQFQVAMRVAGAAGSITLIHCEDLATISCCTNVVREKSAPASRPLHHFSESRPVSAEVIAIDRAIAMCEATGAPTYIVHLSSARALAACTAARARGLPLFIETRPLYLHLTSERYEQDDGALYVAQPPLRQAQDRDALWAGLANGTIDTLGSDHAPWTRAMKLDPTHDLSRLRPGVADLETMLPMLFSEGVMTGRISAERFVALTSTNAARLFGLYPRKGTIAVGSDADLVIWEMGPPRTIRGAEMHSRAGYSVYEGRQLNAWPHTTLRRGEVVFQEGRVLGKPGSGSVLRRGKTEAPT